jgi:hypothetical protein
MTTTTKLPCCLCGLPRGTKHNAKNCKAIVLARADRAAFLDRWNRKHAN